MSGTTAEYAALITSEHNQQPNFMAMLNAALQPLVGLQVAAASLPTLFDVTTAVGDQLDIVGQWIGRTRQVQLPLSGTYFSWDTAGLGWDQANWFGPGDSLTQQYTLGDDDYRLYLYFGIINNQWNGSVQQAYDLFAALTANLSTKYTLLLIDNGDLTMGMALGATPTLNAVQSALFTNGYFDIRPAGVLITSHIIISADEPIFSLDPPAGGFAYGGLDVGYWSVVYP